MTVPALRTKPKLARAFYFESGGNVLQIELENGFSLTIQLMAGKLICSIWDERNCRQLEDGRAGPEEFRQWAMIALGEQPRSTPLPSAEIISFPPADNR
jgi:hypothetical protein